MKTTILIKNGTVVNAGGSQRADVLIRDGKIIETGSRLELASGEGMAINAEGRYLFPGGIDPHVHMHLPTPAGYSSDDFLTGSKAALYGGTTTIIDFVTPKKGQLLSDAIALRKTEAAGCVTDYSFHVSPVEWRDSMEQEIADCMEKEGFRSFKVYMAYKDSIGLNDDVLLKVMKAVGKAGGMVTAHCELGDEIEILRNKFAAENKLTPKYHPLSRPPEAEALAVKKAIELAGEANCPLYIVHVSSKESLAHIAKAKNKGQEVYAETCPQYLLLDDSKFEGDFEEVSKFVFSPPLRKKADNDALWEALKSGVIDTVGTDHCPFTQEQKNRGRNDFRKIPNGAGGVEHRLNLLYTYGVLAEKISIGQFVALTSANAAKIFGMFSGKGTIEKGADADVVIWNPETEKTISADTHCSNCDLDIYEGFKITGDPEIVIRNGIIVKENNNLTDNLRPGRLLKTNPL